MRSSKTGMLCTSTFKGVTNGSPYTTKGPPLDTPCRSRYETRDAHTHMGVYGYGFVVSVLALRVWCSVCPRNVAKHLHIIELLPDVFVIVKELSVPNAPFIRPSANARQSFAGE